MTALRNLTNDELQAEIDRRQDAWEAADVTEQAYYVAHKSISYDTLKTFKAFKMLVEATLKAEQALGRAEREQDAREFDEVQAEQFGTRYDSPSL